uniref:Uncharacterized protein n=1 Tax=Oryza glumipatula TaxID=40148 RepID=A0A0E0B039_9ORYZ
MGPRQVTARPNPAALCLPPPRHPFYPEPGHSWSCTSDGRYRSVGRGGDGDGGYSVLGGSRVAQASAKPGLPPGAWPNCSVVRWRSASAAVLQIPSEEAKLGGCHSNDKSRFECLCTYQMIVRTRAPWFRNAGIPSQEVQCSHLHLQFLSTLSSPISIFCFRFSSFEIVALMDEQSR